MPIKKPIMNHFSSHCSYDTPFFCHYGTKGLDLHCHVDFYEFCIVVGGSYKHVCDGTQTLCKTGHLLFFSPGESHSLIANDPHSYHYSFIVRESFFLDFCKKHKHNAEQILSTPFIIKKASGVQFAYLSQLASSLVYSISQEYLPTMEHFLSNIIFACFENVPDTTAKSSKIYAVDLFQRLNNYETLDIDVTQLYKDYPLSRTALIGDFKELTGYTIVQYRNIKRIEYAAHLLTEANYSVTDIISMLNISGLGYFSKQFKKQYGMTPKQYQLLHHTDKRKKTP